MASNRLRSVAAPPEPAPYDPDALPVHPLFATSQSREPLPMAIETVYIYRLKRGKPCFLGWHPIAEMPDETTIGDVYGAGDYELVGRDVDRSRVLRRVHVTIGEAEDDDVEIEEDESKSKQAKASTASPYEQLMALLFSEMRASRESESKKSGEFLQAMQQNNAIVMAAITQLTTARMADNQQIVTALATKKEAPKEKGWTFEDMHEFFAQGVALGKETSAESGEMDKFMELASSFMQAFGKGKEGGVVVESEG